MLELFCVTVVGMPPPKGQLSLKVGSAYVTGALQRPGVLFTEILAGQTIVGTVLSTTVTVNVQLGPAAVVAVTVVVPLGKKEPDAGE
ncbi:MAG: hypothetical protein IPI68_02345 [Chitinophagaceae bacterium]|nr:hypothetical protein [Chitinophagaceae bacterium]